MPFCANGETDMFKKTNWSFAEYDSWCYSNYKLHPIENIAEKMYGGKNIDFASNIIFRYNCDDERENWNFLVLSRDQIYGWVAGRFALYVAVWFDIKFENFRVSTLACILSVSD